jgi:hypothetical protein
MKRLILLLAATAGGVLLSLPAVAQSNYTWALVCKDAAAPGSVGVGTGVTWAWLHNGVQISFASPPNGFASCATPPLDGSGEIPASIDGVEVNGIAVTLGLSAAALCGASASVTKSFDPLSPNISINANVSLPSKVKNPFNGSFVDCPKASFRFTLR